jgi:hypothetical protein
MGLEPNLTKFQAYSCRGTGNSEPRRGSSVFCRHSKREVEAAEEEAAEAKQEARAADAENKAAREVQALRASTAATRAISAGRWCQKMSAHTVSLCVLQQSATTTSSSAGRRWSSVATQRRRRLEGDRGDHRQRLLDPCCTRRACGQRDHNNEQTRTDFLLATHLQCRRGDWRGWLMRPRVRRTRRPHVHTRPLQVESPGRVHGGFRPKEERFVFLNCLNNILPQMGGRGKDQTPTLAAA